jgi:GT2 family glycosyltransferase
MFIKKNELFIVLVNWNKAQLTINCIESINNSTFTDYKIVVIDNNSHDNSVELLAECGFDFYMIKSSENLGYTGGNNLGIKYALLNKCKYILLLNNDTLIDKFALENLVNTLKRDNEVGIVQPKIYFHPEVTRIWSGPTKFNKTFLKPRLIGYGSFDSNIINQDHYLDYAVGCATLIKAEVFNEIGLLDDDFFAVCEDVDFGMRARIKGYKIFYNPKAIIYHLESASSGGSENPNYIYYQTRSYLILFSKWKNNWLHFFIAFLVYFSTNLFRFAKLILHGNYKGGIAIFLGFRDFFSHKYGKRKHKILF